MALLKRLEKASNMADVNAANNNNNNNNNTDALGLVRDRLFHTLFYKLSLLYDRTVPRKWRRIMETMILSKVMQ